MVAPYVGVWIETRTGLSEPACNLVAPYVGVWIETYWFWNDNIYTESHPMWVCGLKPAWLYPLYTLHRRTLCGCVDWNWIIHKYTYINNVAPYVGVWIETETEYDYIGEFTSHPMWVCGLKPRISMLKSVLLGRTLCGCVDWNSLASASCVA